MDDKVWPILLVGRAILIWHFEIKAMVFDIRDDFWMALDDSAKLALPFTVKNAPVDMA